MDTCLGEPLRHSGTEQVLELFFLQVLRRVYEWKHCA